MNTLDDYQSAMQAAFPQVTEETLKDILNSRGPQFFRLIIDYGMGPTWYRRTRLSPFHNSRAAAEAFYLAQQHVLAEVDDILTTAGITYAVIKGAANRLLLYPNPADRACHDLDILVPPENRLDAAKALCAAGFSAYPESRSISRELVLSRANVDLDLHWGLLRQGRLRDDRGLAKGMLERRRHVKGVWMLDTNDSLFLILVHPAFAKHLSAWDMGLHRVMDVVAWLETQRFDWECIRETLGDQGVKAAAWCTLRWTELLSVDNSPERISLIMQDIRPSRLKRDWLDRWLRHNLSERTSELHWLRLAAFSPFLHDSAADATRTLTGRLRARRRQAADLAVFDALTE